MCCFLVEFVYIFVLVLGVWIFSLYVVFLILKLKVLFLYFMDLMVVLVNVVEGVKVVNVYCWVGVFCVFFEVFLVLVEVFEFW